MQADSLQIWQRLCAEGLASGDLPEAPNAQPWYVSVMLGFAAWVSAVLALAASLVVLNFSVGEHFGLIAVFWTAAGIGLLHAARTAGVFVAQLGLAAVLAGEGAAMFFLASVLDEPQPTLFATALMLAALLPLLPHSAARVLNTVGACVAWVLFLRWSLIGEPWDRHAVAEPGLGIALLSWGLCWLPPLGAALALAATEARWMSGQWAPMLRAVLLGLLLAIAFATPLGDPLGGLFWNFTAEISDGRRNWLALWPLFSLLAAGLACAVAFHQRHAGLLAVCLFGVLLHVSHFYYLLGVSLLVKSLVMLLMGVGLLLAARYGRRAQGPAESLQ